MKRERPDPYVLSLYSSDLLATVLSMMLAQFLRAALPYGLPFEPFGGGLTIGIGVVALLIWTITLRGFSAYDTNRVSRPIDEIVALLGAIAVSALLLAGALYLFYRGLSRLLFVYFVLSNMLLLPTARAIVRRAFRIRGVQPEATRRVLVVGAGKVGRQTALLLQERGWMGLELVGFLDDDPDKLGQHVAGSEVLGPLSQAREQVIRHRVTEVIIALPLHAHQLLRPLVSELNETPANVGIIPDLFPLAYMRPTIGLLGDMPLVVLKEPVLSGSMLLAKRVLDLAVALGALALLWPAMLIISLLVKLDSPGPVLFKQQRIGWHGDLFTIFKFRTMVVGSEGKMEAIVDRSAEGKRFLRKDLPDSRITALGHHLRRWSLDELPQLFNVLKGEMSIVGPRPDLPLLAQDYEPWQRRRFSVPPGITGWWQVTGRSDKPSTLHTQEDLYYVRNYSLLLDLRILLRTVGAVIRGRGAY
jgi:exopolysaccharide biosynthesis polyprenyl glycosylphosphotransferase